MSKLMPWATLWSPALGHPRAATSSSNSCLEQLSLTIVNDNHSKRKSLTPHRYLKSR